MATPKKGGLGKGLGKGLDSLITDKVGDSAPSVPSTKEKDPILMDIRKIEPNREQPRKNFEEGPLQELADSIRQFGVLQPLLVRDKKDYFEIIAGERRWRAAKLAGLKEVPVMIKNLTEQEVVEISLIENIQREELNPIEEAIAYKRLLEEFHLKQEEVAERVSKSRSAVTNSMRLLKLDERVQEMVVQGDLSTGHARALLSLENAALQYETAQKIISQKLSVRETEALVKKLLTAKEKPEPKDLPVTDSLTVLYENLEQSLKSILGTKVRIQHKGNKGKIEIDYFNQEELERLLELFSSIHK